MAEPIILAETDDRRLVQLEAIHEIDSAGSLSQLHTASMTQSGVTIRRIRSAEPPVSFYMDADVMDALCTAWLSLNVDVEAKAMAEQQRQKELVDEAYAMAVQYPAIKIEMLGSYYKAGEAAWMVSVPEIAWGHQRPVGSPENLLELVKCARDAYQTHLKFMAQTESKATA